jgi:hypothetical protein
MALSMDHPAANAATIEPPTIERLTFLVTRRKVAHSKDVGLHGLEAIAETAQVRRFWWMQNQAWV